MSTEIKTKAKAQTKTKTKTKTKKGERTTRATFSWWPTCSGSGAETMTKSMKGFVACWTL